MSSRHSRGTPHRWTWLGVIAMGLTTAWAQAAPKQNQRTFATPQEAIQATIEASEHNDTAALRQIFGPGSKDIVESGDPAQDKNDRAEFARLAREKVRVNQDPTNPDRVSLSVGNQDWPFPVFLVRKDGKWDFDSWSGELEILAHRIGENELNAVEVCRGFVEAQLEYATRVHDGSAILEYAQKILSSPGMHDGLYWEGAPDSLVPKSFASAAAADDTAADGKQKPYHGYYFRILKAQGPDAPGGALSYVVKGKMVGGFAMVAWPTEYGVSGIKTFIVSHEGIVYGKDLGAGTTNLARQMARFNPDPSWHEIELE